VVGQRTTRAVEILIFCIREFICLVVVVGDYWQIVSIIVTIEQERTTFNKEKTWAGGGFFMHHMQLGFLCTTL